MVKVYGVNLKLSRNRERLRSKLRDKCSNTCNGKITDNEIRTQVGKMIAMFAISKISGCSIKQIAYHVTCYGKPELDYPKGLHYNISHSGDMVVCAVSSKIVGIDVEEVRHHSFKVIHAIFTKTEILDVLKNFEDCHKGFCDRWTLKECYIKALGSGLPDSMLSFEIVNQNAQWIVNSNDDALDFKFMQYGINEEYRLSVCSIDHCFCNHIELLDINNLFHWEIE